VVSSVKLTNASSQVKMQCFLLCRPVTNSVKYNPLLEIPPGMLALGCMQAQKTAAQQQRPQNYIFYLELDAGDMHGGGMDYGCAKKLKTLIMEVLSC